MKEQHHVSFFTLLCMISFASVNAVLFTPTLPEISSFFSITDNLAQQTITWFLVGYSIGQLIYGPIANRYGRKMALYIGISLQIISSFLCVSSGVTHSFFILVLGRFLLALGSGVGLKMTFTLIHEIYEPTVANQKISYLMIAFAITPALGVMVGGILSNYFRWESTFYTGAAYGFLLLLLSTQLPETKKTLDLNALKLEHLITGYSSQLKNTQLVSGGLLMGCASCFVYVFAALAPFIAIDILHMSSWEYGMANLLPPIGLISGSLLSAQFAKKYYAFLITKLGIVIAFSGSVLMFFFAWLHLSALAVLFIPMMVCYFGLALIFPNASTLAMKHVSDKSHGSAVMNFINMGYATLVVLGIGLLQTKILLMPIVFIGICLMMLALCRFTAEKKHQQSL